MHILTVLPWRSVSEHRSIMLSDLVKGPCCAINGFILDTNQVQKTEETHLLANDAGLCLTGNSSQCRPKNGFYDSSTIKSVMMKDRTKSVDGIHVHDNQKNCNLRHGRSGSWWTHPSGSKSYVVSFSRKLTRTPI